MSQITSLSVSKYSTYNSGAASVRISDRVNSTVVLTDEQCEKIFAYALSLVSEDVSEKLTEAAREVKATALPAPEPKSTGGITDAEFEEIANEDTTDDLPF